GWLGSRLRDPSCAGLRFWGPKTDPSHPPQVAEGHRVLRTLPARRLLRGGRRLSGGRPDVRARRRGPGARHPPPPPLDALPPLPAAQPRPPAPPAPALVGWRADLVVSSCIGGNPSVRSRFWTHDRSIRGSGKSSFLTGPRHRLALRFLQRT